MKKILDRLHTEQLEREREKLSSISVRRLFWTLPLFSSYNSGLRHCSSDNGQVSCALHRSAALGNDPHFYQNILRDNKDVLMCRNAEEVVEQKNCFTFWLLYKWSPNLQSDELGRIVVRYNFLSSEKILNRALAICVKNVKGEWANVAKIF